MVESGIPHASNTLVPPSQVVRRAVPASAWEALIEKLPLAVLVVGEDDGIVSGNSAARELLGSELGVLVGRNVGECLSPEGIAAARTALAGSKLPHRYDEKRAHGGRHELLEVRAELATDGTERLLLLTLRDVTSETRVSAELLQSRVSADGAASDEQLRQAQKMEALGQLTGGIVHDFNNLLAIIRGNLEIAQRRLAEGRSLTSEIDRALHAAERGATLAQRILAYSRQSRFEPWPTAVNELVLGILDLLRRTLGEAIQVAIELADRLPEVLIDPIQLETALLNLALNSRDAMPEGGRLVVRTALRILDRDEAVVHGLDSGSYVVLAVEDTGCGIPDEVLTNVFDPFFTTKASGKGSGLGLSMVHGFARKSRGTVVVRSKVGVGTNVELYLPVRGPEGAASTEP